MEQEEFVEEDELENRDYYDPFSDYEPIVTTVVLDEVKTEIEVSKIFALMNDGNNSILACSFDKQRLKPTVMKIITEKRAKFLEEEPRAKEAVEIGDVDDLIATWNIRWSPYLYITETDFV